MVNDLNLIGRNLEYCTEILAKNNIKAEFIPYEPPKYNNIYADKIIVRQRYIKKDNTFELTYCMFN